MGGWPAVVRHLQSDVEVAGVPCRQGEAWFDRKGSLIGAALSREFQFGADSFFRYYSSQEDAASEPLRPACG